MVRWRTEGNMVKLGKEGSAEVENGWEMVKL